jgi:exopolysaccharide biosynthesis polyprenyl glycosylphosphotransferase
MVKTHYKARIAGMLIRGLDIVLVIALFVCVREYVNFGHIINKNTFYRIEFSLTDLLILIVLAVLWNRIFTLADMYQLRQPVAWAKRLSLIAVACSLVVSTMLLGVYLMGITDIGGSLPFIFWFSTLTVFIFYRLALFGVIRSARIKMHNIQDVVIVGSNRRSISLSDDLSKRELGINIIGFIDDEWDQENFCAEQSKPFLCSLDEFNEYISKNPVDEVFITLPIRSFYDEISRIIDICASQGIKSRLMTDLFGRPSHMRPEIERDSRSCFFNYDVDTLSERQHDLKRLFDVAVSSVALLVLSPVFLALSLAILVKDGRPVFFAQDRLGLNKRLFKMFKFRTMVPDAEKQQASLEALNEADGPAFKILDDPRITKTGKFLRQTSLDELPQFLNVFLGSMSLVGPRPLPVRDFELFYNDRHRMRFSVKPGITGLWQVSGRSEMEFEEWMALDRAYIDSWSFIIDLKILIRTFSAVLSKKGAR